MQIKAILFDKDGTLFDFEASWGGWMNGVIKTLSSSDPALKQALAFALGYDLHTNQFTSDSPVIAGTLAEVVHLIAPLLPRDKQDGLLQWLEASASTAVMVPVVPLRAFLDGLRRDGYVLGVATNASDAEAQAHLAGADIIEFFDFVAGCDAGYGAKPAPGQCTAFAKFTGWPAAQIAMVGDSLHDLKAGRAAGMTTIGVLTGVADRAELTPYADVVLQDIGDLRDWLRASANAAQP